MTEVSPKPANVAASRSLSCSYCVCTRYHYTYVRRHVQPWIPRHRSWVSRAGLRYPFISPRCSVGVRGRQESSALCMHELISPRPANCPGHALAYIDMIWWFVHVQAAVKPSSFAGATTRYWRFLVYALYAIYSSGIRPDKLDPDMSSPGPATGSSGSAAGYFHARHRYEVGRDLYQCNQSHVSPPLV